MAFKLGTVCVDLMMKVCKVCVCVMCFVSTQNLPMGHKVISPISVLAVC
jgi:hypothetical protein